jgi:hypothetical protein
MGLLLLNSARRRGIQWTPASLTGLQLWLDAADSATLLEGVSPDDTAEDGDTIRQWSDKSGNARHAVQSTAGSRPTYAATGQNGKGVLNFDGSADFMTCGSLGNFNFLHDGTDSILIVVAKVGTASNPNAYYPIIDTRSGTSTKIGYTLDYEDRSSESQNNTLSSVMTRGTGGQFVAINAMQDAIVPNEYSIILNRLRASNATLTNRSHLYINTTIGPIAENVSSATANTANHTELFTIGRLAGASLYFAGGIAEVIACNNPNTSQWSNLLSYLSSKWNIAVDLFSAGTPTRISAGVSAYDAFPEFYDCDGTLVCLFRSGTNHGASIGTITRAASDDGGASWDVTEDVITDTLDVAECPGIVLDNGDLLVGANLATLASVTVAGDAGIYRSSDKGLTFTQVAVITPGSGYSYWYPYGHWRKKGSVIYAPIYRMVTATSVVRSEVWKTEDEGETWSFVSLLGSNYNETSIINTSGTNWLAVARAMPDSNAMAWFTSTDDMATWSAANLTTFGANCVSPHIFEQDGDVWLFLTDRSGNECNKAYRWTGSGWVGGNVWHFADSGTTALNFGYPSVVVDGSKLHVVFYEIGSSDPGVKYLQLTRQ